MKAKESDALKALETSWLQGNRPNTGPLEAVNGKTRSMTLRWGLPMKVMALVVTLSLLSLRMAEAADGELDPTFGNGGRVTSDFFNDLDEGQAIALQSDGRIVVAGITTETGSDFDFALARYNADGSLDPSFGVGGKSVTDFANSDDLASAVAIQSDGRIVVAGYSESGATGSDFALARYNPDGSLDLSFGIAGKVVTDFVNDHDVALGVAIQSDGKIAVTGSAFSNAAFGDFALARYNPDGSLDSLFGAGGKVMTDFAHQYDQANALAIQSDGRIVTAGYASETGTQVTLLGFGLARYNADGSLDTSFNADGKVISNFGNEDSGALALTLQNDGKIVAVGSAFNTNTFLNFALSRFNTDGTLDSSFGTGGQVTTDIANNYDEAYAVAIQGDGRIVVAGFAGPDFGLVRYDVGGSLDPAFGTGGKVVTDFEGNFDLGLGMALQSDGKIVAAGRADISGSGADFALARYLVTPSLPHTLRFYLHGKEVPGTAGGFTMNQTPAPGQALRLNLLSSPSWFSEAPLTGTFQAGATFKVTMPRTLGLKLAMTFRLFATNPDGSGEQLLGWTSQTLGFGFGPRTITIPATTPITFTNQRLKLTVYSAASLNFNLQTGSNTFLEATGFAGTP